MTRVQAKPRKLSQARRDKLDRVHKRDCPGQHDVECCCLRCIEIAVRNERARARVAK